MKTIFNKFILLPLFIVAILFQNSYTLNLSNQSKRFIAVSMLVGAAVGAATGGYTYYQETQNGKIVTTTWWQRCKYLVAYVALPSIAVGIIAGGGSYFFTYEKYFESAKYAIAHIDKDPLFRQAMQTRNSYELKECNASHTFPTLTTTHRLGDLHKKLMAIKKSIESVIASGIESIALRAQLYEKQINNTLKLVSQHLLALKQDPSYIQELQLQTQQHISSAQQQMATAKWVSALNPQRDVIVINPT